MYKTYAGSHMFGMPAAPLTAATFAAAVHRLGLAAGLAGSAAHVLQLLHAPDVLRGPEVGSRRML
jgi:hypothetical protein